MNFQLLSFYRKFLQYSRMKMIEISSQTTTDFCQKKKYEKIMYFFFYFEEDPITFFFLTFQVCILTKAFELDLEP